MCSVLSGNPGNLWMLRLHGLPVKYLSVLGLALFSIIFGHCGAVKLCYDGCGLTYSLLSI